MNNKKSLFVGLLLLAIGLGGAYASYEYGKRVGQSQGYEWGQRKGRLQAARERPPEPIDRKHTVEQLQGTPAFAGLSLEEGELSSLVSLLNRAPSPCGRDARKGVSLATALVDPDRACSAFAAAQVRLALAALRTFADPEEAGAVLRVERRAELSTEGRPVRGNPQAELVLVEWADFQCPYCVRTQGLIEALLEHRDDFKVVFKHFPLSFHPAALPAALAMEAAAAQGQAWEMHDALFALGKSIGDDIDPDEQVPANGPVPFEAQAKSIGLDLERFRVDFRSDNARAQIDADRDEALAVGVKGTPSFFIDGRRVVERPSVENFSKLLDKALGERSGRFSWDLSEPRE